MDKNELVQRILEMPARIKQREMALVAAQQDQRFAQDRLTCIQDDALLGLLEGVSIDGKNAEQRASQIRQVTEDARMSVEDQERRAGVARLELHYALNEFSALKSAARLLAGNGDD